jgi:O-antigen/teichoic acid export membrane protein
MTTSRPGVGTHYRRYAITNVLVMLIGLVSFPLLTRLLDNTQYGMLGYYATWMTMAVAIGKLGAQNSILRFYPHGGDSARMRVFSTNLFHVPLAISLTLWVTVTIVLLAADWIGGSRQTPIFWLVWIAAPMAVLGSLIDTVLRVTERSRMVMVYRIGSRCLELGLVVGAVMLFAPTAFAAYAAKLGAAMLVAVFCAQLIQRQFGFSRGAVDPSAIREGLVYGAPLVAYELLGVGLMSLDRVMIKGLLGDFAAVGIYTIGASLAWQLGVFLYAPLFEAFVPAANRLFMTEGAAGVRALKSRVLMPLTYAMVGTAALLGCFGADLIVAASGAEKAASGPIFAVLGMFGASRPVLALSGYGLLLEKRSTKVLALMAGALLINVALNLSWIPAYGITGAMYASVIGSTALAVGHCVFVPRSLLQLPDARTVAIAGSVALISAGAMLVSGVFDLSPGWPRLCVGATAMGGLYALGVLVLDSRARGMLQHWRVWIGPRATSPG